MEINLAQTATSNKFIHYVMHSDYSLSSSFLPPIIPSHQSFSQIHGLGSYFLTNLV